MLRLNICLALLSVSPLSAEIFDGVDYQFPSSANKWKVVNEYKNDKSNTIIYTPESKPEGGNSEFFGLHSNHLTSVDTSEASIKKDLEQSFGEGQVEVRMLKSDPNDSLYEWWVTEYGDEIMHGWTRGFIRKDGSVVLSYQTMNPENIEEARNTWVPVLSAAKLSETKN